METAGLAALLPLPAGVPDVAVAREARGLGLAPAPLSPWFMAPERARPGLLLGIATAPRRDLAEACARLGALIARFRPEA